MNLLHRNENETNFIMEKSFDGSITLALRDNYWLLIECEAVLILVYKRRNRVMYRIKLVRRISGM